ncbi:hypothetical protein HELRODRAFT_191468 [Helobdella robusta]|uniref:separase n=1 Tax=Helobdella robusta TaxID=6412 RepID=T1FT05_HELRO|nr:hypothetical protein HELRODRAFT_191468 [Helobdella robusta]ESO05402.1 hypothetical protein HELRODRAFT_191468 [Helobdella robusta]
MNVVRWVRLSKNKTISLKEMAHSSSTFDVKNLLGILFSKLSVLSLHSALKINDHEVLNTLLNENTRYFDDVNCLGTVHVASDATKTMNKKKNIKTYNKLKDVKRRSLSDYHQIIPDLIEATIIKFSSKFSWPSQCCSYLSDMQLLKSSMATLLDGESFVDHSDHNSFHSSSSTTTAPKKMSESPVKKVSADDDVFLPPEAPVKKARKPKPLKLEISRSLSSHTFLSDQQDGSMKKGKKLKSIDDKELSDILAETLSLEDRECSEEAGTKTSESCLSADLLKCFYLMHHDPPIVHYRNICHLLALSCMNDGLSNDVQVAYYLAESVAVSFRHMTLVNISKKIRNLSEELDKTSPPPSEALLQENVETLQHLEVCKDYIQFNKECHYIEQFIEHIPSDWSVCQITLVNIEKQRRDQLILTRFVHGETPLNIPLPHVDVDERRTLLEQFDWLLKENMNTMKVTNKKEWWDRRQSLDEKLDELLESFEKEWFSCWIGGLMGRLVDAKNEEAIDNEVHNFMKSFPFCNKKQTRFIKCLFNGAHLLDNRLILQALHFLARTSGKSQSVEPSSLKQYLPLVQSIANKLNLKEALRGPVVFILDKQIQHLPLENMPSLMNERITRQLSLHCMFGQLVCQMKQEKSILRRGVNRSSVFYVVNPDNNLPSTQKVFQDWFETKEPEWTGVIGKPPTSDQLSTNLSTKDLFIYSGHGTGSKYLSGGSLQLLNCRSAVLLMGCSSGRLWTYGQLEPVGMINHYLLAGSCCVVANLWEVTDRDIDRYMESLLKNWMACGKEEEDGSDDEPKTSPSLRPKTCLLENAIKSRLACHFRFLIGAAPVVYGFPIRVDFNKNI